MISLLLQTQLENPWFKAQTMCHTCVQTLLQLLDLIGGSRLPVDPFRVQAMHFNVIDELLGH